MIYSSEELGISGQGIEIGISKQFASYFLIANFIVVCVIGRLGKQPAVSLNNLDLRLQGL